MLLVHAAQVEHDRGGLHLLDRGLAGRRARTTGDVGVTGTVDHPFGQNRLAAGLGLYDHPGHSVAVHDRGGECPCSSGWTPASSTSRSATTLKPSASISQDSD
jgi:hypothetical protein